MTFFLQDDGKMQPGDGLTGGLASASEGFWARWGMGSLSEGYLNFELGRERRRTREDAALAIADRVPLDRVLTGLRDPAAIGRPPTSTQEAVRRFGADRVLRIARQMADEDPAAWSDVDLTDEGIDAQAQARIQAQYDAMARDAALAPPASAMSELVTSFGSSIFNLKALPFLATGLFGGGVRSMGGIALREAGINVGIETALMPTQIEAAQTLGLPKPSIPGELAEAAVAGATFGVAGEAAARALRYLFVKGPRVEGMSAIEEQAFIEAATEIARTSPTPNEDIADLAQQLLGRRQEMIGARGLEVLDNESIMAIQTNADLFQYKADGDTQGVTDRLRGVTQWDSNRTGVALIYEYRDGRREIVDGHQRLGLAKRMIEDGQQVDLPVRVLREADGVTPSMARQIGAEKNIAEGTGTAMDAAKILRESGRSPTDLNLPPSSQLVRDADGLARLSDDAFRMVINGVVPDRTAAVVGRLVPDAAKHTDILGLLARLKPTNAVQTEAIVRQAADAQVTETQFTLFGEEDVSTNLYLERAKVLDQALKDLGRDITTFRTLDTRGETIASEGNVLNADANASRLTADERARASLMRQANTKGPVSDALTAAARAVRNGAKVSEAARQFVADFRAREGAGEGGRPTTGGSRDGAGPAQAARQSEQTPIGEQVLVDQPGIRPDPDRPGLINTRGQGIRFHGSRGEKLNQNLYEGAYSSLNYYGQGFYTTDAVAIAEGYDKGGGIYVVNEIRPVNAFDMEQPIPDFLRAAANSIEGDAEGVVQAALDETRPTVREFYDEIREYSRSYQVPADDVQGVFEVFEHVFKENGFNALDHRGGVLTKKAEHSVRIYFDPHNTVEVRPIDKSEFSMPVATERTAAGEQALIDGVAPIRPVDRLEARQNAPMTGRALPADGGLFDLNAREQMDWLSHESLSAKEQAALFDSPQSPEAQAMYAQMEADLRAEIEADTKLSPEDRQALVADLDDIAQEDANVALAKLCGLGP